MYTFKIERIVEPDKWDQNLMKSSYSSFFQTAEYLTVESVLPDRYPLFISILDNTGNVQGQLGLIIQKSVTVYSSLLLRRFFNFFSGFGIRALWASGPVIHTNEKNARGEILYTIIKALEVIAEEHKVVVITGYTPHQDFLVDEGYKNEFIKNGYQIKKFFTFISSLSRDINEIWNGVEKNARRDVARAKNRNIVVKELENYDQVNDYFSLSTKWAKTKGVDSFFSDVQKKGYWEYYQKGIERVFLAYQDGELISGHRLGCFNGISCSHKLTSSYSRPNSLGGPLLTWYAIEWSKKNGMKFYDFSGGEAPPSDSENNKKYQEQWSSLLAYKRKWGGDEVSYYHIVKVKRKKRYKVFRFISQIDWIYRNYKKRYYERSRQA